MISFQCTHCGISHEELPLAWHSAAPDLWEQIPEEEKARRGYLGSDQCEIDDQHFFIHGLIEIPVHGLAEPLTWGVWVSLSPVNYQRAASLWTVEGREQEQAYFGWLSNTLPFYPPTLNMKTMVHTRPVGERPWIDLEPTDHPLAVEQRAGITLQRLQEILEALLHEESAYATGLVS